MEENIAPVVDISSQCLQPGILGACQSQPGYQGNVAAVNLMDPDPELLGSMGGMDLRTHSFNKLKD